MYVRFVVADIDEGSERERGIFQAAYRLSKAGMLDAFEMERWGHIDEWFGKHLKKPSRFTAAKPPYYRKKKRALSWFKDSAREHLSFIRELVAILEHHGIAVRMLTERRVGYIVYEDEHQIVAEPFADTKR
jgi:uncharacterized protein (DUF305 family)